jgi:hypothetical protein
MSNTPDKVIAPLPIVVMVPAVLPEEVPTHVSPLKFVQTTVPTKILAAELVAEIGSEPVVSLTETAAALVKAVIFPT